MVMMNSVVFAVGSEQNYKTSFAAVMDCGVGVAQQRFVICRERPSSYDLLKLELVEEVESLSSNASSFNL